MFFLLRVAFWLTVVLVLLPSGGGSQPGVKTNVGATEAMVAAGAAVSDMSGFCERQPGACDVGAQAAVAIGQRAQAGAKMVYDFISEHSLRSDSGLITSSTTRNWVASQDTLKTFDLEPTWQGPPVPTETLPMPRRDPRRKA